MDLGFRMHAERTPNPNSIKWVLGETIIDAGSSAQFDARPSEAVSPLASKLFDVDGVAGVFIASNFITVTKREGVEWTDIAQPIVDAIKQCLGDGGSALGPDYEAPSVADDDGVVARPVARVP